MRNLSKVITAIILHTAFMATIVSYWDVPIWHWPAMLLPIGFIYAMHGSLRTHEEW